LAAAVIAAGATAVASSDISVVGGQFLIPNSTGQGWLYGGTDLQDVPVNTSRLIKLRVYNTGDQDLTISLPVTLSAYQSSQYSIVESPSATIAPGQSSPLTISFNPTVTGNAKALVTINNNDPDENPFLFVVAGNAVTTVDIPQPDLSVSELLPPVLKCNSKGICSISGTLAISTTSPLAFAGGTWYISRLQEDGFSGHVSEQIASGKVKKIKGSLDPSVAVSKAFKYKMKKLLSHDARYALVVVDQ
jgi:hypothetical protein